VRQQPTLRSGRRGRLREGGGCALRCRWTSPRERPGAGASEQTGAWAASSTRRPTDSRRGGTCIGLGGRLLAAGGYTGSPPRIGTSGAQGAPRWRLSTWPVPRGRRRPSAVRWFVSPAAAWRAFSGRGAITRHAWPVTSQTNLRALPSSIPIPLPLSFPSWRQSTKKKTYRSALPRPPLLLPDGAPEEIWRPRPLSARIVRLPPREAGSTSSSGSRFGVGSGRDCVPPLIAELIRAVRGFAVRCLRLSDATPGTTFSPRSRARSSCDR